MVVGVQEEEWEGEKAVPFFQPEDSQLYSSTPQSSARQHTLHKLMTKQSIAIKHYCNKFVSDGRSWYMRPKSKSKMHLITFPMCWYVKAMLVTVELPRELSCASLPSRIHFYLLLYSSINSHGQKTQREKQTQSWLLPTHFLHQHYVLLFLKKKPNTSPSLSDLFSSSFSTPHQSDISFNHGSPVTIRTPSCLYQYSLGVYYVALEGCSAAFCLLLAWS